MTSNFYCLLNRIEMELSIAKQKVSLSSTRINEDEWINSLSPLLQEISVLNQCLEPLEKEEEYQLSSAFNIEDEIDDYANSFFEEIRKAGWGE